MSNTMTIEADREEVEIIIEALRNAAGDCTKCEKHDPMRDIADSLAEQLYQAATAEHYQPVDGCPACDADVEEGFPHRAPDQEA